MAAPFAALEARVNAAVFARLANATADFGGGVMVDGVFDNPYAEAFGLVGGSWPTFAADSSALPALTEGLPLTIGAVAYKVAEAHPDGAGGTVIQLENA